MSTDNVDLFANVEAPPAPIEDTLAELVGPGKKYADTETALKALVHSQRHIEKLEQNNSDLRSELNTRLTLEDFVTKVSSKTNGTVTPQHVEEPGDDVPAANSALTVDKVLELVRAEDAKKQRAANAALVKSELVKKYGNDYVNSLRAKAEQLGLTSEDINEMSQTKPKALLALLGDNRQDQSQTAPPRTQLNTQVNVSDPNRRNYAYYQRLYKEDPKRYLSAPVQLEMDREAQRQGSSFFT